MTPVVIANLPKVELATLEPLHNSKEAGSIHQLTAMRFNQKQGTRRQQNHFADEVESGHNEQ